jgi:hypothetical protein
MYGHRPLIGNIWMKKQQTPSRHLSESSVAKLLAWQRLCLRRYQSEHFTLFRHWFKTGQDRMTISLLEGFSPHRLECSAKSGAL